MISLLASLMTSLNNGKLTLECVYTYETRALVTRSDAKQVNAQHLGRWLTMAKLLARSHGHAAVTRDCWEEALRLDAVHRSA